LDRGNNVVLLLYANTLDPLPGKQRWDNLLAEESIWISVIRSISTSSATEHTA
jgi:hypothetical protein